MDVEDGASALIIEASSAVTLTGEAAHFVIRNPKSGFLLAQRSEQVTVQGFSVDYDPLPFSQTRVESVNWLRGKVVVQVEPGFPQLDAEHFRTSKTWDGERRGILKDPVVDGRLKAGVPNAVAVKAVERLGSGQYRLNVGFEDALFFRAGDRYVHLARGGPAVFACAASTNVTFRDLTIFSGPGPGFISGGSSGVSLENTKVVMAPGRWHSVDADGFIAFRNRLGPYVQGALFEGTGDDAINMNTAPAVAVKRVSDLRFLLAGRINQLGTRHTIDFQPGDLVRVYDPQGGELVGASEVTDVLPQILADGTRAYEVGFTSRLADANYGDREDAPIFYDDSNASQGFSIRNTTIRNTRRYGIVVQAHDGLIENNLIEATSANAIVLFNTIHSGSGFAPHDVVIRNNVFRDCYHQQVMPRGAAHAAVVATQLERLGYEPAGWRGIENVTIEGNVFENWSGVPALRLSAVSGALVLENRFEYTGRDRPWFPDQTVEVNNSEDVEFRDNIFDDPRLGRRKPVSVRASDRVRGVP
ncbi:MAG: right-handed parallel beta-helix repeat-containing protein [Myxococcota bacterium]|nr:right-handed parallel beta-helix repeat-containing protein [Myxococcota bacterium]